MQFRPRGASAQGSYSVILASALPAVVEYKYSAVQARPLLMSQLMDHGNKNDGPQRYPHPNPWHHTREYVNVTSQKGN